MQKQYILLLRLSSRDQEALLEILQDYLASPDGNETEDDDLDELNEDSPLEDSVTVTLENITSIIIIIF